MRMDLRRIARQAINWKLIDDSRRPTRPHTDWQQTVKVNIRRGGISWEQIPDLTVDMGSLERAHHSLCCEYWRN